MDDTPGDVLSCPMTARFTRPDYDWIVAEATRRAGMAPRGSRRVTPADVVRIAVAEMRQRIEGGEIDG